MCVYTDASKNCLVISFCQFTALIILMICIHICSMNFHYTVLLIFLFISNNYSLLCEAVLAIIGMVSRKTKVNVHGGLILSFLCFTYR